MPLMNPKASSAIRGRSEITPKRALQLLPLIGLAPLGTFLGEYLDGAGVLAHGTGFPISAGSMFVLPWLVAALFTLAKVAAPIRVLLFVGALVTQGVLMFTFVPPGVTSEMMGIARHMRREFQPEQMRACAVNLRQKAHDGTLVIRQGAKGESVSMSQSAVIIDDSELPVNLRGRFELVFIQPDRDGSEQVCFSLDEGTGILCDSRKHVREFFVCSMAEGVHAYRYLRL
jgi:hypothetical protein